MITTVERLERSLLGHMGRAILDWKLIEEGDQILVAVSGGKDSLSMLRLLRLLQRRAPVSFELLAVNLDQGHPGFPAATLEAWLAAQDTPYRMLREDTYSIVVEKSWGSTYCGLCSRLRRGVLYNAAVELGCNKIALGHHREDALETLLLNLMFQGQLKAMPARLVSDDARNVVIRPLLYAPEEELAQYARLLELPIIPCDLCGSQENLQRKAAKRLLAGLDAEHPGVKASMLRALSDVRPTHLLDPLLAKGGEGGTASGLERFGARLRVL